MSEDGFTLVELLVALGITGATAGLLAAAVSTGSLAWRRSDAAADSQDSVSAAQALLRERIERLAPMDADANTPLLAATAIRFPFLASAPDALKTAGIQPTTLSLRPDGRLVLAYGATAFPVIDDVAAIDAAYYGPAEHDPAPRWRTSWAESASPPRLVRLRVRFAPGDRRVWPDLVIRPAVMVAAGCHVDPQRGTCV
jgi:general secretion pathway protein J